MEFYEVIQKRRTYREFTSEDVAQEVLDRILHAGLQAPTNDHLRNWEFVVLHTQQEKENALQFVKEWAEKQSETKLQGGATSAQKMYAYAMPRQYTMLASCPYVILPFFKAAPGVFAPTSVSSLNSFAAIWCAIENLFLAITAEGLGYSIRIPVGEEGKQVAQVLGAPEGWVLPCYIGIGHPAPSPALEQNLYTPADKTHFGRW